MAKDTSKTEAINDLIRREREEKHQALKVAIEMGLASGVSDKTLEDIRTGVLQRLRQDEQTKRFINAELVAGEKSGESDRPFQAIIADAKAELNAR